MKKSIRISKGCHCKARSWTHDHGFLGLSGLTAIVFCLFSNHSYAKGSWTYIPTLQFQETYSDNIKFAGSGKELGAFVTELSPNIAITRFSGLNTLNLNYRMQNLFNALGNDDIKTFNQLRFNTSNTIVPNKFFLNANSSISQQNISNAQIANDNISGSGNRTNVNTFSLSPSWTPHFGNFANGNFLVNVDTLSTDQISSSGVAGISDTLSLRESLNLNSGSEFRRFSWNVSYINNDNFRANGNDVGFQRSNAIIRTYLNKHINVFVQGGQSANSFQSTILRTNNGFFYTAGIQWIPSQLFNIEVGFGNNSHITLSLNPMSRLSWLTTFRDNQIGTNSGQTWQTALNYRTLMSTWSLTHINDTTTVQTLLLEQRFITVDINPDPLINQPVQFPIYFPTQTDQVIETQTWNFSVRFNSGKSSVFLSAFNQDRSYQFTGDHEKVSGLTANWNWQFAPKTSAFISPRWQQIERDSPRNDNRYDFSVGLNRSITNRLNGRLEYRHLDQSSAIDNNNYEENRATASLFMRF
jgi:uncharacterized protein (PEP-CTERM system associated)